MGTNIHNCLGGTLSWFGNVNYEDDAVWSYTSVPDTPDGVTDDRTLVNAAITFNSPAASERFSSGSPGL